MKKVKRIVLGLWIAMAVVVLALVFVFFAISKGIIGYLPDTSELENPEYQYASQVISADGEVMGTFSLRENRILLKFEEIPEHLINALVATEDVRFYEHSGIDSKSLMRVAFKSILMRQENSGGGSTITQQLAKLLYTKIKGGMLDRIAQKPVEWVIAVNLERQYTKNEIIAMYLNKYDFGNNAVGLTTAASTYFGKTPMELDLEESAMLVGMCQNSSRYNPRRRPEETKNRRNVVLSQMVKAGYITPEVCDSVSNLPIEIDYHSSNHNEGIATYFRDYLRLYMTAEKPVRKNYGTYQQYYDDSLRWATDSLYGWCNRNFKPNGEKYNIYKDGLRIHTTIDTRMQKYLEEAVAEHVAGKLQTTFFKMKKGKRNAPFSNDLTKKEIESIMRRSMKNTDRYRIMKSNGFSEEEIVKAFNTERKMTVFTYKGMVDTVMTPMDSLRYYKHFLRTGAMSMDPITGEVKAYVGGTDFHYFKYDMASVGRRQVGSTVKPFLYALAMERGFTPCDETLNVPQTLYDERNRPWKPRNAGGGHVGEWVSLRWGLSMSNNWISAWLINQLGPYSLKKLIHNFGLSDQAITPSLSLCLGTCDASVSEMVSAYTAFIGKGMRVAPLYVTSIEDNMGNQIASFSAYKNEVISRASSYRIIDMMRGVVNIGTARSLRTKYGIYADMCGKTGTTQNMSDGWFVGYTPSLVTGCWVGGEERSIHFDRMIDGQGATAALPVYGLYMKKVYADDSLPYNQKEKFDIPRGFDMCEGASRRGAYFDESEEDVSADAQAPVDMMDSSEGVDFFNESGAVESMNTDEEVAGEGGMNSGDDMEDENPDGFDDMFE